MSRSFVTGHPFLILAFSAISRLVVPLIAKLAGNRDPDENAISHVFGQQTICVAMDFPGWFEAAGAVFIVAGLMDAFAFYQFYRIGWKMYGIEDVPELRKRLFAMFCTLMAIMSNLVPVMFFVDNPVATPTANSVLLHTVPYVTLQIQRVFFNMFLLAYARSYDANVCVQVAWHTAAILCIASYVVSVIGIIWTFSEMSDSGVEHLLEEDFESPFERHTFFGTNEYMFTACNLLAMLLHPLGLRSGLAKTPEECETSAPPAPP